MGGKRMSNSPLVSYKRISPNQYGRRNHAIDRITPHCVVGQCSVETLGNIFAPKSRGASCNYGIGADGRVGMYVEESCASWCSSNKANDERAVTIECASATTAPYTMNSKVYATLVKLCVDICKRNGKKKLLWLGNKSSTESYAPKSNEMVLSIHRWYANKSCPGDWLVARLGSLASEVTKQLGGGSTPTPAPTPAPSPLNKSTKWVGEVTTNGLNVRTGAGANYSRLSAYPQLGKGNVVGVCDSRKASDGGTWYYIIIAEKYYGWVNSNYIKKKGSSPAPAPKPSGYKVWVGKVTASTLNVRTGAGTSYGKLKAYPQLGKNNLVDVIGEAKAKDGSKWYKIRIANKHVGYVHSAYLKKA